MSIANHPCSITTKFLRSLRPLFSLPQPCRALTVSAILRSENVQLKEELKKQTESNGFNFMAGNEKKAPAVPRPSSSVLLISPHNQVLLLRRVKESSSFPSAHVFPGGNISEVHDGRVPGAESFERHVDSEPYRMAAIRECFEESGILLAKNNGFGRLIEVSEAEREEGRKAVHSNDITFPKWLMQKGGRADIEGLIPFTRWVTPTNVPKRFTTQMYLYFVPTLSSTSLSESSDEDSDEVRIPSPTTDGGLEHTTARFLPASVWLRLAQEGRIIMFPPQFFLLHQVAQHLDKLPHPTAYGSISRDQLSREELMARRKSLMDFVKTGEPPWTDKVISPIIIPARDGKKRDDNRSLLGLEKPGPELAGSGRAGVKEECVLVNFRKEGPRHLAVITREGALNSKLL